MSGREYEKTVLEPDALAKTRDLFCFMLSIGIAPQVVMKYTGHADYKSMKPYIDIAEKAKTDAMDAMEKALGE